MEKILVVDDEPEILSTLKMYLQRTYDILTAEHAEEALKIFEDKRPSVVITDIRMPGMNGIELMRELKKTEEDTEVIVVTGHGDFEIAIEALRLGAADFLLKPPDMEKIDEAIRKALEKVHKRQKILAYVEGLTRKQL